LVETTRFLGGLTEEAKSKVEQFIENFRSSSWDISKEVIGKIAGINEKTGLIFEELSDKLSRIFSKSLSETTAALKELISSVESDSQSTVTEIKTKMSETLNEAGKVLKKRLAIFRVKFLRKSQRKLLITSRRLPSYLSGFRKV